MAKIEMRGMSDYFAQLTHFANASKKVAKAAVYAGAEVMADEIRKELGLVRVVSDAEAIAAWQKRQPVRISYTQRQGLLESLGIARISDKYGVISTKVGFDGYNEVSTKRYPAGQPNAMIARACNSGSTAMKKQPFMRYAINHAQSRALEKMTEAADAEMKKLTGGNS